MGKELPKPALLFEKTFSSFTDIHLSSDHMEMDEKKNKTNVLQKMVEFSFVPSALSWELGWRVLQLGCGSEMSPTCSWKRGCLRQSSGTFSITETFSRPPWKAAPRFLSYANLQTTNAVWLHLNTAHVRVAGSTGMTTAMLHRDT